MKPAVGTVHRGTCLRRRGAAPTKPVADYADYPTALDAAFSVGRGPEATDPLTKARLDGLVARRHAPWQLRRQSPGDLDFLDFADTEKTEA